MVRRWFCSLLSSLMVASLLMGCGATSNAPAEATGPTSAEAEAEGLPSGDVSLRVWGAEEDEELINQIISNFISEYGSMANLKITFEPHSESSCKDELLGDVLNAPDVFTFADDQLLAFIASGVLKSVENGSEISERNLAAASEGGSYNGTLYAYPLTADNGYFMFYNKEFISDEAVQTLDGLMAAAAAAGKKVFIDLSSGWYMYTFFGNTDMEIGLGDDGISTICNWNAKYTNITGLDVAEAMMAIASNPGFSGVAPDGFAVGAADGTFAAGVSGVWDENAIKEAWGDNYAATKLPTYTVAGKQLQMSSYAGYKLVGVNSYSSNAAWAAKFADFMTNEQSQTLRFEMRGQGPSNKNASTAGEVAQSKALQALQQQAEFSSHQRVGGTYWEPAGNFGSMIIKGNPSGKNLQALLNEMVTEITGEESTGDKDTEETGEAPEEATEEVTEETTEEATQEETAETNLESTEENGDATEETAALDETEKTKE